MLAAFALIWQAAQLDLTAKRIDDPQHVFKPNGRLASLQVNNEAHTHPCRQGQLWLCQRQMLASSTQSNAELLRRSYGCHKLPVREIIGGNMR